jgi:hypothetical protein
MIQTFLPYTDPWFIANALDKKRLGKQRVDGKQIIDFLEGRFHGDDVESVDSILDKVSHPAVRMWEGHGNFLKFYVNVMITIWIHRGHENVIPFYEIDGPIVIPLWVHDPRLQYSHRANLVRMRPAHFKTIWPNVDPETPYWWPVSVKPEYQQAKLDEFWGTHRCISLYNPERIVLMNEST